MYEIIVHDVFKHIINALTFPSTLSGEGTGNIVPSRDNKPPKTREYSVHSIRCQY
jgi:hypothetical protein